MDQILTRNVANSLYWLGRYLERVESTLIEINRTYDEIIDVDSDAGKNLYLKFGLELEYTSSTDFLYQSIFGSHSCNLVELLEYARENAIISRSYIGHDAFGTIIQLDTFFKEANTNKDLDLDFRFIDEALSLISEIWGELTRKITRNVNDYFLLLGKYVEKVDFHLRLGRDKDYAMILMAEIDRIVKILSPNATFTKHDTSEESSIILDSINNKINKIVEQ
jgi:uncharacterized alpha-E superfamily protein